MERITGVSHGKHTHREGHGAQQALSISLLHDMSATLYGYGAHGSKCPTAAVKAETLEVSLLG